MTPTAASAPAPLAAFCSDDLTGGTDLLGLYQAAGASAALFLQPPTGDDLECHRGLDVIGVAGLARTPPPEQAHPEVSASLARLRELGAPLVQYKVCSTFDSSPQIGNIGAALRLGAQLFDQDIVPVVGGTPHLGRYCVFGNLFAATGTDQGITRLDRHPSASTHPTTPMTEAELARLFATQAQVTTEPVDVHMLGALDAPDRIRKRLIAGEHDVLLLDALTESHTATVGEALWSYATERPPLFAVGAAGLTRGVTQAWQRHGTREPMALPPPAATSQLLVLAGSMSPITARQLDHAEHRGFHRLGFRIDEPDASDHDVDDLIDRLRTLLRAGQSVIAAPRADPKTGNQPTPQSARALTTRGLSRIARALRETRVRTVVCGGDTSSVVARALEVRTIAAIGDIAPAVPLCRVNRDHHPPLEMVFKGGQVGGERFLERLRVRP